MGLNDLGRKGVRAVIVTKKEGDPVLEAADVFIGIHRQEKTQDPVLSVEMPKPRPPGVNNHLHARLTQPTSVNMVSGTGINTTNLASDK